MDKGALLLDVPNRQLVLTIPKTLRIFFNLALDHLSFLEREGWVGCRHGEDGAELERMDYLELIARVTSHIPDKGQVMVRYHGLYANAPRGKAREAGRWGVPERTAAEEIPRLPSKGWAR